MVLNEIAMAFLSNIIIYYIMVFFVFIAVTFKSWLWFFAHTCLPTCLLLMCHYPNHSVCTA